MKLPQETAAPNTLVRFGRYTARRLLREGYEEKATLVRTLTLSVRTSARKLEDLEMPEDEAMADRDAVDDDLDDTTKRARLDLASADVGAYRQEPYKSIFPEGVDYFTRSPIPEQEGRYGELSARLVRFLPEDHPVRVRTVPTLESQLSSWKVSKDLVTLARNDISLAKTELDSAISRWREEMEKIYGWLVSEVGKERAERYFPRKSAKQKKAAPQGTAPAEATTKAA